jgi:hypothetical protein
MPVIHPELRRALRKTVSHVDFAVPIPESNSKAIDPRLLPETGEQSATVLKIGHTIKFRHE